MADQSNEMVERVARALADQSPRCRGWWSDMSDLERTAWRNSARAAIEAMRTPTEAMARGAMAAHSQYLVGGSRPLEDVLTSEAFEGAMATFHRSYTAAIDAALSHDEVKG